MDEVFLLQLAIQGYNLEDFNERRIALMIKKLVRNGFLSENGQVTQAGKDLYASLFSDGDELQLNKIEQVEDDFEKFWKAFPPNDTVKVEGKILYKGSRTLKQDKDKCKIKFHQILSEGEHTAADIIKALNYEVQLKIEKSIKEKTNKLSYLKNSHAWLNQRAFEGFIDEAKEVEVIKVKKPSSWDTIA